MGTTIIEEGSDDEASVSTFNDLSLNEEDNPINIEYQDVKDDPLLEDMDEQSSSQDENRDNIPREIQDNLDGNYWRSGGNRNNGLEQFALSVIHSYANLDATIKSTPQYGFQKGMSIFQKEGHEATIKELDENLVG